MQVKTHLHTHTSKFTNIKTMEYNILLENKTKIDSRKINYRKKTLSFKKNGSKNIFFKMEVQSKR